MTVCLSGLRLIDHHFEVPLNHENPTGPTIEIFGREAISTNPGSEDLPWLVFFQGGPGHASPRPTGRSGWLRAATEHFRVFLLDQRGTGRSTPVLAQTLVGRSDSEIAEYLRFFRADSIVRDAEHIRSRLAQGRPWTGLGQSYGGFCLTHYLSAAPEGLAAVLMTGGIPPILRGADEVYAATYDRVRARNRRYFNRYPDDLELLQRITDRLARDKVLLPGGSPLTLRKLQQLGLALGMSDGFESVHYLLENAFVRVGGSDELSYPFLCAVDRRLDFELCPIYAVLHESIYAQGSATRWAAQRVHAERPEFSADSPDGFHFTGEMVYPWMFEDYAHLRPLAGAAELLAQFEDWPELYNLPRLSRNEVPIAAIVYENDMYVERRFCAETADHIPRMQTWITNEYDHNGLRADGERIFSRLLSMIRDQPPRSTT